MAEKRLQNVLAHLSPPLISYLPSSPLPHICSSTCFTSRVASSDLLVESSSHIEDAMKAEDRNYDNEEQFRCRRPSHLEFRGPTNIREGKLLENMILCRIQKNYTDPATRIEVGLDLGMCTNGVEGNVNVVDELGVLDLVSRETENVGYAGVLQNAKFPSLELDEVEVKEQEMHHSDAEIGVQTGGGDGCPEAPVVGGPVRAGIVSATAVSKEGPAIHQRSSSTNSKKEVGGPVGSLVAQRVATCVFCDIVHGAAPCLKLYEDESCLCILDIHPLAFGHSLVLPKAHFPCLEATPPQIAAAMCAAVPLISSALLAATRCDSFNMLVNSGVAAGQVIFHTHFHIIPRCVGDGLWKSESSSRQPLQQVQEAKRLAHLVRTKLSK